MNYGLVIRQNISIPEKRLEATNSRGRRARWRSERRKSAGVVSCHHFLSVIIQSADLIPETWHISTVALESSSIVGKRGVCASSSQINETDANQGFHSAEPRVSVGLLISGKSRWRSRGQERSGSKSREHHFNILKSFTATLDRNNIQYTAIHSSEGVPHSNIILVLLIINR